MEAEQKQPEKLKSMLLKNIPADVYDAIIDEQAAAKKKCKCQRSLQFTAYQLIRKAVQQ